MYLDEFCNGKDLKVLRENCTFKYQYSYWKETLLEYATKLFSWDGLPESIPQREIELNLLLFGRCGITKNNDGYLIAVQPFYTGITDYPDVFTDFTFATPLTSGQRTIGINGEIILNNSIQNRLFDKIHMYAMLLGHVQVSFFVGLINGRATNNITVPSDNFKSGVQVWLKKLFNGELDALTDKGFSTIEVKNFSELVKYMDLAELWELRNKILASFLEELGIKHANEKRERMIVDEANANDEFLHLNLTDMLDQRQLGCERINKLYGLNVSVKCNIPKIIDSAEGGIDNENIERPMG